MAHAGRLGASAAKDGTAAFCQLAEIQYAVMYARDCHTLRYFQFFRFASGLGGNSKLVRRESTSEYVP